MPRSRRSRGGQSNGKREWRRVDLHVHTPGSKDFNDPDASYLDILKKAEAEGIDVIAFTDHNTVAGYGAMMQEISDLQRWEAAGRLRPEEKTRLDEYRRVRENVLVLPGMEVTATFGFHILGIFDPETPVRVLEHVLLRLNVPLEALDIGETEVGATTDVLNVYRVLAEAGGLVIAAHANSSNGVAMFGFDFGGQTKIAYTQDPNLHALEVTDLETTRKRTTASFFSGSRPQYPRRMHCIQGSDAHRIHGIPGNRQHFGVGERATEVLMGEVSFRALKEVFLGQDFARTRPFRRTAEPFDYVASARKEGPTIVQSFHEQMTRQGGRLHAIMRDVVAFANTNGGTIYVGVSPNTRVGVRGIDKPDEAIAELRAEIERLVTPPIEVSFNVVHSGGKSVVVISVPKGPDVPYALEGSNIYLRQEAETSLAMRDEIVSLIARAVSHQEAPEAAVAQVEEAPQAQPAQPEPQAQAPEPVVEGAAPNEAPAEEPPAETDGHAGLTVEPPRTGVEIVDTVQRKGVAYHTMCDLRNGGKVQNVTRASARRLWRYAIALKEKHTFQEDKVTWHGDLGLWHKYLRAGRPHYDLVQKGPNGDVHIYYGVTEDGIHGPWRAVAGIE